MNTTAIFLLAFALGGICGLLTAPALRANGDDAPDDDAQQDMKTESEVVRGLKCYQRMGELDKEFTCRMERCPYWSKDDDTGTSLCNVPQIINDAIAELEAGHGRAIGTWLRVPDYPGDENNPAWDCSECGRMYAKQYNFCPGCGAKMQRQEQTTDNPWRG